MLVKDILNTGKIIYNLTLFTLISHLLNIKRMFKKFLSLLPEQFSSKLLIKASAQYFKRRLLLSSLRTLHSYTHSFSPIQNQSLIHNRMRNFHKKRSWKKFSLYLFLGRVKHSIVAFCVAWHKGNNFNLFTILILIQKNLHRAMYEAFRIFNINVEKAKVTVREKVGGHSQLQTYKGINKT